MFDIGWSEMLVVAAIAIVVIGPKDLPAALRQAGKWMGALRRMAADFQGQVNEAMKEAELDGLRRELTDLKQSARGFSDPVTTTRNEVRGAIEGKSAPSVAERVAADLPTAELPKPASEPARPKRKPKAKSKPKAAGAETSETVAEPRPADLPVPPSPEAQPDFDAAETKT